LFVRGLGGVVVVCVVRLVGGGGEECRGGGGGGGVVGGGGGERDSQHARGCLGPRWLGLHGCFVGGGGVVARCPLLPLVGLVWMGRVWGWKAGRGFHNKRGGRGANLGSRCGSRGRRGNWEKSGNAAGRVRRGTGGLWGWW